MKYAAQHGIIQSTCCSGQHCKSSGALHVALSPQSMTCISEQQPAADLMTPLNAVGVHSLQADRS